jgi:hypothetical protein
MVRQEMGKLLLVTYILVVCVRPLESKRIGIVCCSHDPVFELLW